MKKCFGLPWIVVSVLGLGFLLGCQEQNESAIVKKARLVGQENIELQKQIKQLNLEIQKQKDLVEQCNKDMAAAQQVAGETSTKMLEIVGKSTQEAEALRAENEQLKARIAELEAKAPKP